MYNKILVAIDLTEEADDVLKAAQQVAEQNGADLHLLTVVKPITYAYSGYEGVSTYSGPSFEVEAQAAAKQNLLAKAEPLGIAEERVSVLLGGPAHEIKDHATKIDADLIIMGTHGRHGVGLIVLGSTANGVLHGAPCDVLTIKVD